MRLALFPAAILLCANSPEELPELSFFERAELPEATLLNADQFGRKLLEDYPMTRTGDQVEGALEITVIVTTDGRATQCQMKRSSGNAALDRWACSSTVRYARFTPATNENGEPILSKWTEKVAFKFGNPTPREELKQ